LSLINIIADENIDFKTIKILRENGFNIVSVFEEHRGVSDFEIIELAKRRKAIIITRDKDFGEWVYSFKENEVGIILLRYQTSEIDLINSNLILIINKYNSTLYKKFVVVQKEKIRIKNLLDSQ
jgi:predicted nuclease of predicted toxin-antitoxin system